MSFKIKDTIIVIQSSGRAGNVIAHECFPDEVIEWVISVPYDQYDDYKANYPNVRRLPKEVPESIADQIQHIFESYTDHKYIWLIDDDLRFLHRNKEGKLRKSSKKHIRKMMLCMRKHIEEVPMVGIGDRMGNNLFGEYKDVTGVRACYCVDTEVFKKVGAVFNPIPKMLGQDTHMNLCFLNAGYKTRLLGDFAWTEKSNAPGGCSVYRTQEHSDKCSIWMTENHPETKLVMKETNNKGWGLKKLPNGKYAKLDYRVSWKKAYKPKKKVTAWFIK